MLGPEVRKVQRFVELGIRPFSHHRPAPSCSMLRNIVTTETAPSSTLQAWRRRTAGTARLFVLSWTERRVSARQIITGTAAAQQWWLARVAATDLSSPLGLPLLLEELTCGAYGLLATVAQDPSINQVVPHQIATRSTRLSRRRANSCSGCKARSCPNEQIIGARNQ